MEAAKHRAQYELYYADRELRKLNYSDVAYAPLDEIFDQAATEWYKGCYYEGFWGSYYPSRAAMSTGNEYVYNVSKSLRSFTRCQALARKVYNALVPPATRPEELGLREWFGDWGEWVTCSKELREEASKGAQKVGALPSMNY